MPSSNKKVLLMGRAGAGKTSMRSIIFANYVSRDTKRLTATNNIEHSNMRFLGNLTLSLWDCGGQDSFMENYFESQREHIFRNVEVLIYVLEVRGPSVSRITSRHAVLEKDLLYMRSTLESIKRFSPEAKVFCLIHKMDLVSDNDKKTVAKFYEDRLAEDRKGLKLMFFRTSIYDETLFNAWSKIVNHLVPNITLLHQNLEKFCKTCRADEIVLFEKYTFLVISHFSLRGHKDDHRFERICNLYKQFKLTCGKAQANLEELTIQTPGFKVFTNLFTQNTYVMLVVTDPIVEPAAIMVNIDSARSHFEMLTENMASAV